MNGRYRTVHDGAQSAPVAHLPRFACTGQKWTMRDLRRDGPPTQIYGIEGGVVALKPGELVEAMAVTVPSETLWWCAECGFEHHGDRVAWVVSRRGLVIDEMEEAAPASS